MTQLTDVSPLNAQFLRKNFVLRQGAYVCICRSRFMRGSLDANCPTVLETACDCPTQTQEETDYIVLETHGADCDTQFCGTVSILYTCSC